MMAEAIVTMIAVIVVGTVVVAPIVTDYLNKEKE